MDSDYSDDELSFVERKKLLYTQGKEGTIFLIDASQSMFENGPIEESPFHLALTCAKSFIANKAISGTSDLTGIVLFGTKKGQNTQDLKNVFVIDSLKPPSADYILEINELLKLDSSDFAAKYGHDNGFCLGDAFWVCNSMFSSAKTKFFLSKILIFTATEDLYTNNKVYKNQSISRANDLNDWGIEIDLVAMKLPFKLEPFYEHIVTDPASFEDQCGTKLNDLMAKVRAKSHKQRVVTTLPVYLSSDLKFTVNLYVLIRETKKPSSVMIRKKDNEILKREVVWTREDTHDPVDAENIRPAIKIADEQVIMEKEDVSAIKNSEIGFHLLGFKPLDLVLNRVHYYFSPGYFLYPTESGVKGSIKMYNALHLRCAKKNVAAIVKGVIRTTSTPHLMALIPVDDEFLQGFYVFNLPFADDFRSLYLPETTVTNDPKSTTIMKDIIARCSRIYSPDMIRNPVLQLFWSHIEALALAASDPDPVIDMTDPNRYINSSTLKPFVEEFIGRLPKSQRKLTQPDVQKAWQNGELSRMTVVVLKDFAIKNKLKYTSQRKADLCEAIENFLGNKGQ